MDKGTCSVDGCEGKVQCRGWCEGHYRRWLKHGEVNGGWHPYQLDDSFFDIIDTEAKAYWLGFITADGCVRDNGRHYTLQVKLKQSDAGHLAKLQADLGSDRPLYLAEKRGVAGASAMLAVSSKHLVRSLEALGVTPRKSQTAQPWLGAPDLMRHYWRGMFDGDGSISLESSRAKWVLTFCGSRECVTAFAEWSRRIAPAVSRLYDRQTLWYWKAAGVALPQAIAAELYGNATVYLDRKFALATELAEVAPARPVVLRSEYCTADGCARKTLHLNLCRRHYLADRAAKKPPCSVSGCGGPRFVGEHCQRHYGQIRAHGAIVKL